MIEVIKTHEDSGFCRIYYKSRKGNIYCQQEEFPDQWFWYNCTQDGEPNFQLQKAQINIVESFKD